MEPQLKSLAQKRLIGIRLPMSLSHNKTGELWRSFMLRRKEITNNIGNDLYSVQVFDPLYFKTINPATVFEKWATIEVADFQLIPKGMLSLIIPEGLYAVFLHQGAASAAQKTFQYIFEKWLPNSGYLLDYRPHFEILGEKYKNGDPSSEEEIYIPVKPK